VIAANPRRRKRMQVQCIGRLHRRFQHLDVGPLSARSSPSAALPEAVGVLVKDGQRCYIRRLGEAGLCAVGCEIGNAPRTNSASIAQKAVAGRSERRRIQATGPGLRRLCEWRPIAYIAKTHLGEGGSVRRFTGGGRHQHASLPERQCGCTAPASRGGALSAKQSCDLRGGRGAP